MVLETRCLAASCFARTLERCDLEERSKKLVEAADCWIDSVQKREEQ
jgi:hypothetical protein